MGRLVYLLLAISVFTGCKKDYFDYRDSIVGTYHGIKKTYITQSPNPPITGTAILYVAKENFNDTSIVITGDTEHFNNPGGLHYYLHPDYSFSRGQFYLESDSLYIHEFISSGSVHTYFYLKKH